MANCKECGVKFKEGDLFCSKCGTKVNEKKQGVSKKKPEAETSKKEKTELSEDAKKKVKGELEISIKAFKRGDISIDEFQDIKKSIVAKAKAGYYDEPEPITNTDLTSPAPIVQEHTQTIKAEPKISADDLYIPLKRKDEPPFSKLWYLVPIIFNLFGGIVAYFAIKHVDEKSARGMIAIGALSFVVMGGALGYFLRTENILNIDDGIKAPTEIVIEDLEDESEEELSDLESVVDIKASNNSAEEMNLKPEDLDPEFKVNSLFTGIVNDALEFTLGNSSWAEELISQGWLENHRIVFVKDIDGSGENTSIAEVEIDASISKYNVTKLSGGFLDDRLMEFESGLNQSGFSLINISINESGVMGKMVETDPDFDIKVTYRIFFYNQDTIVRLSVFKVGRGLEEEEVTGYARVIEGRIK
jgi:uncharacterized Zn finger protein (UPF0148 family)